MEAEHFCVANAQPCLYPQSLPATHASPPPYATEYHPLSSKTASVRGEIFEPVEENAAMYSPANVRASQWEPCTKQLLVSWFSRSAPARVAQPKKACAAAATRGVEMRATQSLGAFPVEP